MGTELIIKKAKIVNREEIETLNSHATTMEIESVIKNCLGPGSDDFTGELK